MRARRVALGVAAGLVIIAAGLRAQGTGVAPAPTPRAHAHNDYEHARPLLDALDQGFTSVEADVWLVDGRLLVAHDRDAVRPDRTLESLYLDPLLARVGPDGRTMAGRSASFILWIDVKSDAERTYAVLRDVLTGYASMLTRFTDRGSDPRAVTVILSGNRARETVAGESLRHAAIDGRLPDLDTAAPVSLVPVISDNWQDIFTWRGEGPLGTAERERLRTIVARAHAQGRLIRFWAMPDSPAGWQAALDAGVDFINTDDLAGVRTFLANGGAGAAGR